MANDTKRFKNLKIQFTPSKQNNKSNSKAQEITQEQVQWQVNSSKMATLKRKKNCTKCRNLSKLRQESTSGTKKFEFR